MKKKAVCICSHKIKSSHPVFPKQMHSIKNTETFFTPNERRSRMHTTDPVQLLTRVLACFPFCRSPFLAMRVVMKMQPCMPEAESISREFEIIIFN